MSGISDLLQALGITAPPAQKLTEAEWAKFTRPPTERETFLASRDTSWSKPYGGVVPYYPQQRYLDKNLAPELGMTATQLEALAQANEQARATGLMSNKLADKMLPTLLVEGASGTRGWGYPDKEPYRSMLTKAGLPPTFKEALASYDPQDDYARELFSAKMMHAMMAAKAHQFGDDLAVERWNGMGTAKGGYADAKNHARKVRELEGLLGHEKNKEMVDAWDLYRSRHRKGEDAVSMKAAPEAPLTWAEENLPTFFERPVTAARKALPNVSLQDVQRAVRNWTAPKSKKRGGFIDKPIKGGSKHI